MRGHNMKYSTALLVVIPLLCAFVSCADDIDLKFEQQRSGFTIVGNPVEVRLSVAVSDLDMNIATRAEDPLEYNVEDTEDERHIDDLWLFEYDQSSGELIYTPQQVTITDQSELADISVTLSDNYGKKVVLYVVANSGSGVSGNSKEWVVYNSSTGTYDGFMTIDELKKKAIPTPHPQRMTWDETEQKYVLDSQDASAVSIPMSGYLEGVTINENADILVPVERMFAKVLVRVDLSDFSEEYESAWLNTVTIGGIPEYCAVGTLWDGKTDSSATPANYADCERWLRRTFNAIGETNTSTGLGSENEDIYPYVIYVPENIQGENQGNGSADKAENVPNSYALSVVAGIYVIENGSTLGEYTSFTAYPGGNTTTNFNVRRNCVYRVTMRIIDLVDNVLPSANCIICLSGETTAFFPYCRTETGGGYDFEDYLYAYSEGDEGYDSEKKGQKIDHVGIVWQSTDGGNTVNYSSSATGFIGDNSEGNLVWIDDVNSVKDEYHRRIHVTIPEDHTGNALIGAYNSDDEIIWSWHVWSRKRENDPTTVNTKLYYTYEWDNDGIYGYYSERPRVAGYTIMNCNLGAMQDEPSGSIYAITGLNGGSTGFNNARPTFGTLYQWGRKDPFPPIRAHIAATTYGGLHNAYYVLEEYSSTYVGRYFDNGNNVVSIVGTDTPDALFHSVPGTERKPFDEMIPLTIQNPTVFYAGTKELNQKSVSYIETYLADNMPEPKDGNWMLDSDDDHFNRLWGGLDPEKDIDQISKSYDTGITCTLGNVSDIPIHLYDDYGEKSIFDPCPYGWRVSPPDLWLGFTVDGLNAGDDLGNANYNDDTTTSNFSGMAMYLTAWRNGETSFFPCQGTRAPDGCAYRSGQCGNYNNATSDANDRVNTLHIHYQATYFNVFEDYQMEYYIKSTAGPLRCVRIDSVVQ